MQLAQYLKHRSNEICQGNGCTETDHYCDSYAYINSDMQLMDICLPDYFQGSSKPYAAIPLPWNGTEEELEEAVNEQIEE